MEKLVECPRFRTTQEQRDAMDKAVASAPVDRGQLPMTRGAWLRAAIQEKLDREAAAR